MNKLHLIGLLFCLFSFCACNSESTEQKNVEKEPTIQDLVKDEPVEVERQTTFDQSQLNSQILGLCVKFKTLKGADRKHIFELFDSLLPHCKSELKENNQMEMDPSEATQIMSINDLKEILGTPTLVRKDGMLVYDLTADGSYRVVFPVEPNGSVACRVYEADS